MLRVLMACLPAILNGNKRRAAQEGGTQAAQTNNSRRNAISKKEADRAHAMYRLEAEQDDLESVDFGEAYNFHMDCGDR